jgi:acetyl-CoA C-acetyltransferase
MESIKDKVAIIGMGCTKFGELWDKSDRDLIVEACYEAFEDAGVEPRDIQAAWHGTVFGRRTGRNLAQALRLEYVPVTRVENLCATGAEAFRNACYAIAAGIYDIALACGVEKMKDSGIRFTGAPDEMPRGTRVDALGVHSPPSLEGLIATRYFHSNALSYEEGKRILAAIAVKNHHNGTLAPKAHLQREVTIDQVVNAPMIAYPLGILDCCPVTDGGAAAIITRSDMAKHFRDDYILVKGLGVCCGALADADYDYSHFEETIIASRMAYQDAGIKAPRHEIDIAEVHDAFTILELMHYNDLGFTSLEKAKEDVTAGTFALAGELPVNTDGGCKCFGHPIGATGLRMLYEVYKQLQGKAGPRQAKKADIGLTHNIGGTPGSYVCAVCILGRRD